VKAYGVFVNILKGQDVLVPVSNIPEGYLAFTDESDTFVPDLKRGQVVGVRILEYRGKDATGRDRYQCSMMPPDPQEEQQADAQPASDSKGYDYDAPARGRSREARYLENAHTLAMEEGTQIKLRSLDEINPKTLAARYAAKGFSVVDDETADMLQTVVTPKAAPKSRAAARRAAETSKSDVKKQVQVWIMAGVKSKSVGFLTIAPNMTEADKEKSAVELAIREDPAGTANGTAIKEVVVSDKKIEIRVPGSRV